MVQFNLAKKEVCYKIIYYGPSSSGKKTTLQFIDQQLHPEKKKLAPIAVGKDSDLSFHFLSVRPGPIYGLNTQFQLFAVPGNENYRDVRKLILQDVDGIVLVCDSQNPEGNSVAFQDLKENLADQGAIIGNIPMVIQWNKRDLSSALNLKQLQQALSHLNIPEFTTVATTGEGVFLCLEALANMLIEQNLHSYPPELQPSGKEPKLRLSFLGGKTPEKEPAKLSDLKEGAVGPVPKKPVLPQFQSANIGKTQIRPTEEGPLTIEESKRTAPAGDVILLRLKGRIDPKNAQKLKQHIHENYLSEEMRLILDMEEIEYIHSTAFGMLLEIATKAKLMNGGIRLIHVTQKNRLFFEMMCMEGFLPISETEEEAVSSFQPSGKSSPSIPKQEKPAIPRKATKDLMATLTGTQAIRLSEFSGKQSATRKIFISYCREDVELAERLEQDLQGEYDVWRGRAHLTPGKVWSQEISKPIRESDVILLLWSESAYKEDWVKHEWLTALTLKKKLIPCLSKVKLRLPLPLQNTRKIFLEDYKQGLGVLLQECKQSGMPSVLPILPPYSSVPFPMNPNFLKNNWDLVALHHQVLESRLVIITQPPSVNVEGTGKTQFALEYAYRFGLAFDGILWIHAANDWRNEFIKAAREIGLTASGTGEESYCRILKNLIAHLGSYPNTLIVMDNVLDFKRFQEETASPSSPLSCGCYLLCTTPCTDLPSEFASAPIELLAEDDVFRLIARVRELKDSREQEAARQLCRLTEGLPLLSDFVTSFLRENPQISVESYASAISSKVNESGSPNLDTVLNAVLAKQYSLIQDPSIRLLFEIAGQLPSGQSASLDTIAILMGIATESEQVNKAIEQLSRLSLIIKLPQRTILLHPVVHSFARSLQPPEQQSNFLKHAAQRMFAIYRSLPLLERECQKKDVEEILKDLQIAHQWSGDPQIGEFLEALSREKNSIQNSVYRPCGVVQQICSRFKGEKKIEGLLEKLLIEVSSSSHRWPKNTVWLKRINHCLRQSEGGEESAECLNSACFHPAGQRIATGTNGTLTLWLADTGEKIKILVQNFAGVRCLRYSPDGKRLLATSFTTLELWDMDSYERVWIIAAHSDSVLVTAFSSDGKTILSAGKDRDIKLWDGTTGKLLQTFPGPAEAIRCLSFSPDNSKFLCGSDDGLINLWDVKAGKPMATYRGHFRPIQAISFSADGEYLLSGGRDGLIKLWEISSGKESFTFTAHTGEITSLALSSNGAYMASASEDKTLNLWALEKRKLLQTFLSEEPVIHCMFSQDNREIWACDRKQSPEIYKFQIMEIR